MRIRLSPLLAAVLMAALILVSGRGASAGNGTLPQIAPPFEEDYTVTSLGMVPGLPADYGGITLAAGGSQSLLIGGAANEADAEAYLVPVVRDAGGHITGFNGNALAFSSVPHIDGGLTYGPGGVLFYSRYNDPLVEIGQIATVESPSGGDTTIHKVIDLAPLGVSESPGGLNFVPPGFPGAGQLKMTSYDDGNWYSLEITPDGTGTFNVTSAAMRADLTDGKEGFAFVPRDSPAFGANPQVLINEYDDDSMGAFELDTNGDPVPGSRRPFITDLDGPDGAFIDPLSGDLLITEYRGDRLLRVEGFAHPYGKGDSNCDGLVNAVDALAALRRVAELLVNQQPGCPPLGGPPAPDFAPQGNGAPIYGDVDCDHDLDAVDALHILKFVAFLPVNLPQGCPPLGAA